MKKYWYKYFIGECPVCGKNKSYKVRQYTLKPSKLEDRYIYLSDAECYDWCDRKTFKVGDLIYDKVFKSYGIVIKIEGESAVIH